MQLRSAGCRGPARRRYRSVFKGSGIAFEEVREYQPGDEIRTIDWNVTARMGHPFIKRYIEERELTVVLLMDARPASVRHAAAQPSARWSRRLLPCSPCAPSAIMTRWA